MAKSLGNGVIAELIWHGGTHYKRGAPLEYVLSALLKLLQKGAPFYDQRQIYRARCAQGKRFDLCEELCRQGSDGKRHRDQSQHYFAVHRRAAWRFARHLRRRNLGRLVVRFAEAARFGSGGL